jgi:hypothetical protein
MRGKRKEERMDVGDIVRITCAYIPGLEEVAHDNEDLEEDLYVMGRTGTILTVQGGSKYRVRVDGYGVGHGGWWFPEDALELVVRNPDYTEA